MPLPFSARLGERAVRPHGRRAADLAGSLSLATKLAPEIFRTQMVALLFLSIALGTAMAGVLAEYCNDENQVTYFGILGGISIVTGIVLVIFTPPIRKLMGGVR